MITKVIITMTNKRTYRTTYRTLLTKDEIMAQLMDLSEPYFHFKKDIYLNKREISSVRILENTWG